MMEKSLEAQWAGRKERTLHANVGNGGNRRTGGWTDRGPGVREAALNAEWNVMQRLLPGS